MKLTWEGIKDKAAWEQAGIKLPSYDVEQVAANTKTAPRWVHLGIGNIFRIFIGSIADQLIEEGDLDSGIVCVETFDMETIDKIYRPYDNLSLSVILNNDGTQDRKVLGCFGEALKGTWKEPADWQRLKEVFRSDSLQLVSFTITEKGYALTGADGQYFGFIQADIDNGPDQVTSAVSIITSMLLERYKAGGAPIALVSMDNCSHNGERLRNAVLEIAGQWKAKGFVDDAFIAYISDEEKVAFPWSMIDKITPRPDAKIAAQLEEAGVEDMDIVITQKKTYIAPFVNAEGPQYLVIEDHFPNGRPPLEKGGVYMTDRETVNKSERMKVTVCLNPLHQALGPYGIMLGYTLFSDAIVDPQLSVLADLIGRKEGMEFVEDPGILSPKAFIDECIEVRFPNPYLGDTCARLVVDISQMEAIRFGQNVNACVKKYGSAERFTGIPLAIAGWIRYLLAVDDKGQSYELSPDPMNDELLEQMKGIEWGKPETLTDQIRPILANPNIFDSNLYESGIGDKVETMVREMLAGEGSVRATLVKYLG